MYSTISDLVTSQHSLTVLDKIHWVIDERELQRVVKKWSKKYL